MISSLLDCGVPASVIASMTPQRLDGTNVTFPSSTSSQLFTGAPWNLYNPMPASGGTDGLDLSGGNSPALGGDTMTGILGSIPNMDARQSLPSSLVSDDDSTTERGQKALTALNAVMNQQGISGTTYPDFKTALGAWADAAQPIQRQYGTELNSKIYLTNDGWQLGPAYSNGERTNTNIIQDNGISGGSYWGYIHTHPENAGLDYPDEYSGKVYSEGNETGGFAYVSLPNGQINGWAPSMGLPDIPQFIVRPPADQ